MSELSEARVRIYVHKVKIGQKKLDDVPASYRAAVRIILKAEGYNV